MKTVNTLDFISPTQTVVALGCFDGVHMGHREVIHTARKHADRLGLPLAVLTFSEPPKNYFVPHSVRLLTDEKTKEALIASLGVDLLVCVPFDRTIATMPAEAFFRDILLERMKAAHIVCGFNYSFGEGGKGTPESLLALCQSAEIGLNVLSPVTINGIPVSSSAIRLALEEGCTEEAEMLLGRPYSLTATVFSGQRLARNLGFPTLNQVFPHGAVIPKHGVYAVQIHIEENKTVFDGIANIGSRPTVNGNEVWAETHIFDFEGDLYGKWISVFFRSFLRPERKFESLDALTEQVQKDILQAKAWLNKDN